MFEVDFTLINRKVEPFSEIKIVLNHLLTENNLVLNFLPSSHSVEILLGIIQNFEKFHNDSHYSILTSPIVIMIVISECKVVVVTNYIKLHHQSSDLLIPG